MKIEMLTNLKVWQNSVCVVGIWTTRVKWDNNECSGHARLGQCQHILDVNVGDNYEIMHQTQTPHDASGNSKSGTFWRMCYSAA